MKLKLELQDGKTILSVTEDLSQEHAAILRAGLIKLFQSGKKSIVLDLTGATASSPAVLHEIAAIQNIAPDHEAMLLIACAEPGVGHAPTREETLKMVGSTLANLLSTEAVLQAKVKKAEARKGELEARLSAASSGGMGDVRSARRRNKELKRAMTEMEQTIKQMLAQRAEPPASGPLAEKQDYLDRTLVAVLEQEGLLPVL